MSELVVTEADREKAREVILAGDGGPESWIQILAAALAAERAKAREPFLALADHYRDLCMWDEDGKRRTLHRSVSDRIRRAAEETE